MAYEFHNLEESLKAFYMEAQNDSYNSKSANFYKYNNLKIMMDIKKLKTPHFIIRVGISDATFNLENCERISGGLGVDEIYVYRWYEKPSINAELKDAWKRTIKFDPIVMKNPDDLPGK